MRPLSAAVLLSLLALTGCGLGSLPPVSATNAAELCRLAHSRLDSDAPEKVAKALERCSDPAYIEPWLEEYADVKALVKAQRAGKARP